MSRTHAVVWLDERQASIFEFGDEEIERNQLKADSPFRRVRRPAGASNGKADYFDDILKTVASATDWAIVGPAAEARELGKYVEQKEPRLRRRLIGVEPTQRAAGPDMLARCAKLFSSA